jgi:hypothetical protein
MLEINRGRLASLVGKLVDELPAVFDQALNPVLMELAHIGDLAVYSYDQELAGLVLVVLVFYVV